MQWLIDNKEWVFSGIGLPICAWIITMIVKKKNAPKIPVTEQSQTSGNNSTNIQGGNDVNISIGEKKC
ncbi:hypothetical protein [Bacillus sp. ISL-57]|uniref:hypothetical protein n=1 Tax=Bacillus sp. ISL-57 TaxID=2819135 RepID=UPI001BE78949|nr:hypothetical protein [Bacillus sp. ISL-57]MBT2714710.1 hypothetical protein [Bacillus sp. ISL-57]